MRKMVTCGKLGHASLFVCPKQQKTKPMEKYKNGTMTRNYWRRREKEIDAGEKDNKEEGRRKREDQNRKKQSKSDLICELFGTHIMD